MSARRTLFLTTICATLATIAPAFQPARAQAALPAQLQALDRGPTDAQKLITITVHLAMPDRAGFETALAALYDRASPRFHHWMTDADLQRFAPPAAQRVAVQKTLEASGLTVLSTDRNGFSIRARGTVGNVARAFNTEIHDFERNGETFRGNISPLVLNGSAAPFVHAVAGIESHIVHPMLTRSKSLKTGQPPADIPLGSFAAAGGFSGVITDQSLSPAGTVYSISGTGKHPIVANYSGIVYGLDAELTPDFTPKQLEQVYGLPAAYRQNLTGAGQTIVLIEGYGYPTAEADANAQFKLAGIKQLDSSNFSILYPDGIPDPDAGILAGWNIEIALDIQSSHAIAPGANIVELATNGQDGEDFQYSMQYVIDNNIGTAVSDSWEEDQDLFAGAPEQQSYEDILELAAAKGISFQFSTGDGGDGGLGTPIGAPGVPAVAPHATAVGGTAIVNNVGGKGFTPVSWGDALSEIGDGDPAPSAFFYAGGGGGESVYWPKPGWQESLPGLGRQTPDVSALADPFTGFPLVITESGVQVLAPGWGGTSLSSPIFTAIWVIAQQAAGGPLGQASPLIAGLTTGLRDVVPLTNANDLTVAVQRGQKTKEYSTLDLFNGVYDQNTVFVAALFGTTSGLGFAFGLDSSLTATVGWDNATGYGTPQDALAFINAIVAAAKP